MQPTVEMLVSKLHTSRSKHVRNDWSDENNNIDGDSMENDMRSIISNEEKIGLGPSPQA